MSNIDSVESSDVVSVFRAPCVLEIAIVDDLLPDNEAMFVLLCARVNGEIVEDMPFDNYIEFEKDALLIHGAKHPGGPFRGNHGLTVRIPFTNVREMKMINERI